MRVDTRSRNRHPNLSAHQTKGLRKKNLKPGMANANRGIDSILFGDFLVPSPGKLVHLGKISRLILWAVILTWTATLGCRRENSPMEPVAIQPPEMAMSRFWAPPVGLEGSWPESRSSWNLPAGRASLEVSPTPTGLSIDWVFSPPLPEGSEVPAILLSPAENQYWLAQHLENPGQLRLAPLPLPRIPVASDDYQDLTNFLKEMTANHFNSIVCHWPGIPIPVRVGQAQSDQVDLSRCLSEAVERWNQGEPRPWFQLDENADWGVRLVHFPGAIMRPPLQARITRLDSEGRPLRLNIIAGANYDGPEDRPYATRGMVHELGHALFLWGHSRDRQHVLWESGPPLVDMPSEDERKAARLWHGLPEGLDLNNYFSEY
jgi:hypothetical protein